MILVKEEFLTEEKTIRAMRMGGAAVVVLWLALKGYAARKNTGGFVPDEAIDHLVGAPRRPRVLLTALVECGLSKADGERGSGLVDKVDHGWQLHDYSDHSTSPDEIEDRRERERERKALYRAKSYVGPSVYVMRRARDGALKIGYSENPRDRRRTIESEEKTPVELLGFVDGTTTDEAALHSQFSALRIGRSEWFQFSLEIVSIVDSDNRPPIPPRGRPPRTPPDPTPRTPPDPTPEPRARTRADAGAYSRVPSPAHSGSGSSKEITTTKDQQPAAADPDVVVVAGDSGDPEDPGRETMCPTDLLARLERNGTIRLLAEKLVLPIGAVRHELRSFEGYWTIGKGAGQRRTAWAGRARQWVVDQHAKPGGLKAPGAIEHAARTGVPDDGLAAKVARVGRGT